MNQNLKTLETILRETLWIMAGYVVLGMPGAILIALWRLHKYTSRNGTGL